MFPGGMNDMASYHIPCNTTPGQHYAGHSTHILYYVMKRDVESNKSPESGQLLITVVTAVPIAKFGRSMRNE